MWNEEIKTGTSFLGDGGQEREAHNSTHKLYEKKFLLIKIRCVYLMKSIFKFL
jgi:hypothetical protein